MAHKTGNAEDCPVEAIVRPFLFCTSLLEVKLAYVCHCQMTMRQEERKQIAKLADLDIYPRQFPHISDGCYLFDRDFLGTVQLLFLTIDKLLCVFLHFENVLQHMLHQHSYRQGVHYS